MNYDIANIRPISLYIAVYRYIKAYKLGNISPVSLDYIKWLVSLDYYKSYETINFTPKNGGPIMNIAIHSFEVLQIICETNYIDPTIKNRRNRTPKEIIIAILKYAQSNPRMHIPTNDYRRCMDYLEAYESMWSSFSMIKGTI